MKILSKTFFRSHDREIDHRRRRAAKKANPIPEVLEDRRLLSGDTTTAGLSSLTAHTNLDVILADSSGTTGLTPAEIRSAYEIDLISFSGGTVTGNGAGETIAIVDAYNDPDIAADLTTFDQEYGLSAPPSLTVDNLGGSTTSAGWALETALDVEWAHAIAPGANILLVEAASDSLASLYSAVTYASKQAGVTVVSMSWGSNEFKNESKYDSVFTTPSGHVNVAYVAASGDSGAAAGPEYPSVSPNVLAVGGTTLTLSASGTYSAESGWSGSTGGFSGTDSGFRTYESEPSYQTAALEAVGLSDGERTTPDVSFNADTSSGVSVYDSVGYGGQSGWFDIGGTSAAAPAWAGLVAIADQGLATGGKGSLTSTELLTELYSLPSSDYNDITTGSNGYAASAGYDLVTGLGTPRSNLLVAGLLAANGVSETSTSTSTSSTTAAAVTTTTSNGTTSPHKVKKKTKHTRVVVQKHHKKVARAIESEPTAAVAASSSVATSSIGTLWADPSERSTISTGSTLLNSVSETASTMTTNDTGALDADADRFRWQCAAR